MKKSLNVYYGFSKLTKKIVRKPELAVYFENANHNSQKNLSFIERRMHIVHTRKQSMKEMEDADMANRTFVKYGYFIDEKPFNGNIEQVLEYNFLADQNHVSNKERSVLREKLRLNIIPFMGEKKTCWSTKNYFRLIVILNNIYLCILY